MKNADKPAYPTSIVEFKDGKRRPVENISDGGLTKRERFAMAAMQGIVAGGLVYPDDTEFITTQAAKQADALLAELENSNQNPE